MNKFIIATGFSILQILFGAFTPLKAQSSSGQYSGRIVFIDGNSSSFPPSLQLGTPLTGEYTVNVGETLVAGGPTQFPVTSFSFTFPTLSFFTIEAPLIERFINPVDPETGFPTETILATLGAATEEDNIFFVNSAVSACTELSEESGCNADGVVSLAFNGVDNSLSSFVLTYRDIEAGAFFVADLAGNSQSDPIIPTTFIDNVWVFNNVPSRLWYDPPLSSGYTYRTTAEGLLFTRILGFPTGFDSPFTVEVEGNEIGVFEPGDTLIFPNGGVSEFSITGINPKIDIEDPLAFPIQLEFNSFTASFEMSPLVTSESVPEPSTILGLGLIASFGVGSSFKGKLTKAKKK